MAVSFRDGGRTIAAVDNRPRLRSAIDLRMVATVPERLAEVKIRLNSRHGGCS
jgi:hypothetical protein